MQEVKFSMYEPQIIGIKENFINLLNQNLEEEVYQKFLEEHTQFVPTKTFELNHGVHCGIIFRKLRIGTQYTSDFFFITKSSAEWRLVFIELEKPSSKFFNKDETISTDLNKGITQVRQWMTYLDDPNNLAAFINQPAVNKLLSTHPGFANNPKRCYYILVTGRRDSVKNRHLLSSYIKSNFYIMTYDALYAAMPRVFEFYLGYEKGQDIIVKNEHMIAHNTTLFEYPVNCENIRIKQTFYDDLVKYCGDKTEGFLAKLGSNTGEKLQQLKENIIR